MAKLEVLEVKVAEVFREQIEGLFRDVVDALVSEYEREKLNYPRGVTNPVLRNFAIWVKEQVECDGD